jgi:transketolase N-terminal domain/subunit
MLGLNEHAYRIRRNALRMGEVQGQGYIAQALGIADVLAVAYFHALRYRPEDPEWEGRDRFLLSIGHYAIALYAATANLTGADLGGVKLSNANLSGADLSGASLWGAQVIETDFTGANLTGCRIYGVSAWGLKLEGAKQENLVITHHNEPTVTVDNIEVAQFIYLMLNNQKVPPNIRIGTGTLRWRTTSTSHCSSRA